jgi:hypothetical protein
VTGKEENQNMFYVSVSSTQTLENSIAGWDASFCL